MLLTNAAITAGQAVEWSLASRLVDSLALREEALETARVIAGHVRGAMEHTKTRLRSDLEAVAEALNDERHRFVQQITTPEARVGMARFLRI